MIDSRHRFHDPSHLPLHSLRDPVSPQNRKSPHRRTLLQLCMVHAGRSTRETNLSWQLWKWRIILASCTYIISLGLLFFQGIPLLPLRQLCPGSSWERLCYLVWPSRVLRLGCPKILTPRNLPGIFSRGPKPLEHGTMGQQ